MIVGPHPVGCVVLRLVNRLEQVVPQPIVANGPVVSLDVGVLLWIARLSVIESHAVLADPFSHRLANVLRSVVPANRFGFTPPLDNLIQRANHTLGVNAWASRFLRWYNHEHLHSDTRYVMLV